MTKPYQILPNLDPDAYLALKRDIEAHGIQVPIEVDEAGNVLDGHHRLRIAHELGLKDDAIPRVVRAGLTEEQKLEHVLRLNLLRRHLTREQKQALAAQLRQQGWTQERIAAVLGVSQQTVSNWLQDVTKIGNVDAESGKPVLPSTITDTRGRVQPATKPRRATPHQPDSDNSDDAAQAPGFVADTAAKTGLAPDVVREGVGIGENLVPAVRDLIRETPLASRHDELLALARLAPDEQEAVAQAVVSGEFECVADAVVALRGEEPQAEANRAETTELPQADTPGAEEAVESAAPSGGEDSASEQDVSDTEPRDPNAPPYPFLARPGWKPYHVMEALEHLSRLPADEHAEVASLLDQPGIPPTSAIEIVKNLIAMMPDERQAIYRWNRSDDPRERSLALTQAARKPPMPDPRLRYIADAMELIAKAIRLSEGKTRQALEDAREWLAEILKEVDEEDRHAAAAVGWPRPAAQ